MKKFLILSVFISALAMVACRHEWVKHPCYDASLVHNGPCTMDCPGIVGCDGKSYCNECEAARHGISKK